MYTQYELWELRERLLLRPSVEVSEASLCVKDRKLPMSSLRNYGQTSSVERKCYCPQQESMVHFHQCGQSGPLKALS